MIELRRQESRSRLTMSITVWTLSLELAHLNGWKPAGTRYVGPAGDGHVDLLQEVRHLVAWQTEYRSSDGQTVDQTDAAQLADGLNNALVRGKEIIGDLASRRIEMLPGIRTEAAGFRWFTTAEGKVHLKNLIDFCREGAFQIC